jgi:hypothetical protein
VQQHLAKASDIACYPSNAPPPCGSTQASPFPAILSILLLSQSCQGRRVVVVSSTLPRQAFVERPQYIAFQILIALLKFGGLLGDASAMNVILYLPVLALCGVSKLRRRLRLLPKTNTNKAIIYIILLSIYNISFHPLSKFPGPKSRAASEWPYFLSLLKGTSPQDMLAIHERYQSPVVRVSPDELSFVRPAAFRDIYGHRKGGRQELAKDKK